MAVARADLRGQGVDEAGGEQRDPHDGLASDHAGLPDDELGLEQQLLVPVVGVARLVQQQLRRPAAELEAAACGTEDSGTAAAAAKSMSS